MARISLRRIFNFHYITDEVIVRVYRYMLLVNNVVHYCHKVLLVHRKRCILYSSAKEIKGTFHARLFITLNDSVQIENICYILLYGQLELT